MSASRHTVTVTILDKEYRILCKPEESESLKMSALYLDKKMRDIRNSGKVVGLERMAVMAALNISHDYLKLSSDTEDYTQAVRQEIQLLLSKVDDVVENNPA